MSWRARAILATMIVFFLCPWPSTAAAQSEGSYDTLVALYKDIRADGQPAVVDGVPDYRPAAIRQREDKVPQFRRRLAAINPSRWPVSQQVDYLLVQAALNNLEFQFRVEHPWTSDPGFYVEPVERVAYSDLPVQGEKLAALETRLNAVPKLLAQAKGNLTHGAREFTKLALHDLNTADGVGHGMPFRDVPPAGTHGWYVDFIQRAKAQQPELVPAAGKALAAVDDYDAWLKQHAAQMTAPAGVGKADFNWYLRYVRYLPYTMDDSVKIGWLEYHRAMAFLALQRHVDRNLPEIALPRSKQEYDQRLQDAEDSIRQFIIKNDILTIPPYAMGHLAQNVPWIVRPTGPNFWEQIQYRDPRPDTVHATLPGHAFDGLLHRHDTRPIRGTYTDSGRTEGWAFYLEESMLQLGFLDHRPRTKELYYIFQAARGLRDPAEAELHTNQWTVDQAVKFMVENVPYMDDDVARVDCAIYLREPTYGLSYQLGKEEMLELLGDREHQLGEKFNLKQFYDQFLAEGTIPISLSRWEMTGVNDEVKQFWRVPPIPSVSGER